MSEPKHNEERRMLDRLIELEAEKNRDYLADKLSEAGTAALLGRLRAAEKADRGSRTLKLTVHKPHFWRVLGPASIAAVLLLAFGLWRLFDDSRRAGEKNAPQLVLSIADVVKARGSEMTAAKIGERLTPDAELSTGRRGAAVATWQADEDSFAVNATLGQEASIRPIKSLMTDKLLHLEIEQRRGSVAYAVNKNRATLHVTTPAAIVEVVGTNFIVSVSLDRTTVLVAEGSVNVKAGAEFLKYSKTAAPKRVPAQQKMQATIGKQNLSVLALSPVDQNMLSLFEKLTALKEIPEPQREKLYEALSKELIDNQVKVQNASDKRPQNTEGDGSRIKGKLSRVTTISGRSYVGFYMHRGDYIEVETATGKVKIPVGDIQEVRDAD